MNAVLERFCRKLVALDWNIFAMDADRWITVHPNGEQGKGRPALIDEKGTVKAGMGGKFNGRNIDDIPRGKNPHPVREEKYQARQARMVERQSSSGTSPAPSPAQKGQSSSGLQAGHKSFPKKHAIKGEVDENGFSYYVVDNPLYKAGVALRDKIGEAQFRKRASQDVQDAVANNAQTLKLRKDKVSVENGEIVGGAENYGAASRFFRDIDAESARAQKSASRSEKIAATKAQKEAEAQKKAESERAERVKSTGVQRDPNGRPIAPKRPGWVPEGYWNGKVYSGNRVYIDGREIKATPEKIEALQKWQNDYAEYKKARDEDARTAPKEYLNVSYAQREQAKAAGARWDPNMGSWYWDKRDGDVPQALSAFSRRGQTSQQRQTQPSSQQRQTQPSSQKTMLLPRRAGYGEGDVVKVGGQWVRIGKTLGHTRIDDDTPSIYGSHLLGHEGEYASQVEFRPATPEEIAAVQNDGRDAAMDACLVHGGVKQKDCKETSMAQKKSSDTLSLDAAPSMRSKDANGFLHVASSNISKETVNPYYGREIPGWEEKGLDPNHIFYGYRAGEELAKAAKTFDGLPLLIDHHIEDAEAPQKEYRVGSLGTDARWEAPYLKNSLIVTDAEAIRAIEDGRMKELSCAYRYEPDWTPGTFEGVPYDFIMRNIQGNHVALVEEGRAGADVVVADSKPRETATSKLEKIMNLFKRFRGAKDSDPAVEKKEVELAQGIIDLHKKNPETGEIMDVTEDADKAEAVMAAVNKIAAKLSPEEVEELTKAIQALGMDEEVEEVVETEDDDLDTAEAVKYGEEKERDKLMSEHMREDEAQDEDEPALDEEAVKEAADKCGMDAEDPMFQKVFAEGVRYGEKKEKAEPEHLDRLHESEGMKKAMDEEEVKTAMDAALRAASTRAEAKVVARFRALSAAASAVRPVLGDIDPLAFDSADSIYGAALKAQGVDIRRHPRSAWRSIFEVSRQQAAKASIAQDSSMRRDYSGAFAGLNRIKRG